MGRRSLPLPRLLNDVRSRMSIARKVRRSGGPKTRPKSEMVFVPGGALTMSSDRHYEEEKPAHRVRVDGSWIDQTPVTNAEFARFVKATRYTTFAQGEPDPKHCT